MDKTNHILANIPIQKKEKNPVEMSIEFFRKMEKRRSVRKFSPAPIEKEVLYNAIKAAGTAPSGANRQPWYFALITTQIIKDEIRRAAEIVEHEFYTSKAPKEWIEALRPFGTNSTKSYLSEAPALIAVFSRNFTEADDGTPIRSYYPIESTGIATGILITALHNAGLATLTHTPKPMNFLNEILNLDTTFRPFMIVVAGHAQFPIVLPHIERKPMSKIFKEF